MLRKVTHQGIVWTAAPGLEKKQQKWGRDNYRADGRKKGKKKKDDGGH